MNSKQALACAALLLAGCDDTLVTDKVAAVLEHGGVDAAVECSFNPPALGTCTDLDYARITVRKFQDGSVMIAFAGSPSVGMGAQEYYPRGYTLADPPTLLFPSQFCGNDIEHVVGAGDWSAEATSGPDTGSWFTRDISTYCTGFNLEAFE